MTCQFSDSPKKWTLQLMIVTKILQPSISDVELKWSFQDAKIRYKCLFLIMLSTVQRRSHSDVRADL